MSDVIFGAIIAFIGAVLGGVIQALLSGGKPNGIKRFLLAASIGAVGGLVVGLILASSLRNPTPSPPLTQVPVAVVNTPTSPAPSPTLPASAMIVSSPTMGVTVIPGETVEPTSTLVVATTEAAPMATNSPEPALTPTAQTTSTETLTVVSPTVTPDQPELQNACNGRIETSRDAVQSYSAPDRTTLRLIDPGTIVVVINKLETAQTGKWYQINDEGGNFLGWVQAVHVGLLSPNCSKY